MTPRLTFQLRRHRVLEGRQYDLFRQEINTQPRREENDFQKPAKRRGEALLERARKHLPGAQLGNITSAFEDGFIVKEGRGSKLYDFSGNEYIDYLIGSGPMILGHAHPAVLDAVREWLDKGSTYFITSAPAIELAEEVCRAVPCAEKVRFTTSGTDATFQCLRQREPSARGTRFSSSRAGITAPTTTP